jgi:peptide/nickel transport system substrate-binding protein
MIKNLSDLTRRDLLVAGAAALGAGLAPQSALAQGAPKRGGRFRLGLSGANTGDSHDPATWGTGALINFGLWGAVYNNLLEIGPDGKVTPELAESFEASPMPRSGPSNCAAA